MTLRAGAAVDRYEEPSAFDAELDRLSPEYLECFAFDGLLQSLRPPDRVPPRLGTRGDVSDRNS